MITPVIGIHTDAYSTLIHLWPFRHHHGIVHFKIQQKVNKWYLQVKLFDSVEDLIKYYGTCDVPNLEGVKGVRLLHPVICNVYTRLLPAGTFNSSTRKSSRPSTVSSTTDETTSETHNQLFQNRQSSQMPPPLGSAVMCRKGAVELSEQNVTSSVLSLAPSQTARSDEILQRPPIPLPPEAEQKASDGIYNGVYYSHVKQYDRTQELITVLENNTSDVTTCQCGLDVNLSKMPQGWTMHINHDKNSNYGRPFFMSPSEVTSWELPDDISLELDEKQKKLIKLFTDYYRTKRGPPDKDTIRQWSTALSKANSTTAAAIDGDYLGTSQAHQPPNGSSSV